MNNLILCGFMGCGKSTLGRTLSTSLSMEYLDLDTLIEQEAAKPIPAIFSEDGESHFRDLEHHALCKLSQRENCIISTGGGAMTFLRNVQAIDFRDTVIFLDTDFESCYCRIVNSNRPLVQSNSKDDLLKLFELRRRAYLDAASIVVDASFPPEHVETLALAAIKHL